MRGLLFLLITVSRMMTSFLRSFESSGLQTKTSLVRILMAQGRNDVDRNMRSPKQIQQVSSDPWKVLIRKLDSSRAPLNQIGKVEKASHQIVDELQCVHFGTCSGCTIKGNFTQAPIITRAKQFFLQEGIIFNSHIGNVTQWRTNVKLAVQPSSRWGGLKIGLYRMKSHTVEPIPDCKVHHPLINIAVEELRQHALDSGVLGYQEPFNGNPSSGELRYIQMSLERYTGKIQLTLVWNTLMFKYASQSLNRLVKKLKQRPDLWHSISVNFQTSDGNTIFNYNPKAWKLLWGPPVLKEKIGNATFFFKPQIFRQANLDLFERGIVPLVERNVPVGSQVAELYSGIGVLGLNVADRAEEVLCSDNNEYVDGVFDSCADSLPEAKRESVFFECMAAEEAVEQGQCEEADVIIVDPPRKGLDDEVIQLLTNSHPTAVAKNVKRLIYVSCGFEALERDTRILLDSSRWKVRSADGFLLFPGTDYIETVAVFDRK